ncbi:MAG TPA: hypothetical protein VGH42_10340 [Verrucomicrobiae bacterium]
MKETLQDAAYKLAKENYGVALFATRESLERMFSSAGFDAAFHAAERGMQFHLAAHRFAERVWAKELPYEKAESSLRKQFHEFSEKTCQKAFSEAYTETR